MRMIFVLIGSALLGGCGSNGSLAAQDQIPHLQISKAEDGSSCNLVFAVSVPQGEEDLRGNYVHVAATDRSGRIVGRIERGMNGTMFQAGYKTTVRFPIQAPCEQVVGVKIYTFAFMRPNGAYFPGQDRYTLELEGLQRR